MADLATCSTPDAAAEAIVGIFLEHGQRRYDEVVTQEHHAVQAALLADREDGRAEIVVAALLHDLGHLLLVERGPGSGAAPSDLHHEAVGAAALARWFPPAVTAPIALHVAAKRYLCAVDPRYHASLSRGSVRSLRLQGGAMAVGEVRRFESHPSADAATRLRRWDDRAKEPGRTLPPISDYRPLLVSVARISS